MAGMGDVQKWTLKMVDYGPKSRLLTDPRIRSQNPASPDHLKKELREGSNKERIFIQLLWIRGGQPRWISERGEGDWGGGGDGWGH